MVRTGIPDALSGIRLLCVMGINGTEVPDPFGGNMRKTGQNRRNVDGGTRPFFAGKMVKGYVKIN